MLNDYGVVLIFFIPLISVPVQVPIPFVSPSPGRRIGFSDLAENCVVLGKRENLRFVRPRKQRSVHFVIAENGALTFINPAEDRYLLKR